MKLRIPHLLSIILLFVFFLPTQSKDFDEEQIRKNLPKMLGANNQGREFYFSFVPCWETADAKNDLKLYISSGIRTKVTVEVPGKGYEKIKYTIPNDIIEFTLSPAIGQAYRKTDREVPEPDQVWPGAGIRVVAEDPIICYGVTRYMYTSDGFLCVPVPALGKEYIVASYADVSDNGIQWLPSMTAITTPYDKTTVRFTMGGTDWSQTVSGLKPTQTAKYNMNSGDVLLFSSLGTKADLSGSTILASKPVSVVSGNFCAYVPTQCGCCDVIEEMELPTMTWGTEYHVTKIYGRLKNSIIKVFAKEPKTKIYRDYQQIAYIINAGGLDGVGWTEVRADYYEPRPVVISGDKPINVTQFNTGQGDDNIVSDPFQLVLTPIEQYQREIIFNTPGIRGGVGFPSNYINLSYEATEAGVLPDDLAFAQVVAGEFEWKALRDMSPNPGEPFFRLPTGKHYYSKTMLLPGDGVYKIRGSKPFAAYAYGFSWCDSYGFPTSVALGDLTKIDTLPPEPEWEMDCFGNVNMDKVRYVADKPNDPENRSNLSSIYLRSDSSYNYKIFTGEFMPCEDPVTSWGLRVVDSREDAYAVVIFTDCAGNDTTLRIKYNAVKLRLEPEAIDFGLHSVGETTDHLFRVVNFSETAPAELYDLRLKLKDEKSLPQGFTLWDETGSTRLPATFNPPVIIAPLESFPFIVRFDATEEGEFWDSIGWGDTCVFWYESYVHALVGKPVIDVTDYDFPPTMLGNQRLGQFEVSNIGSVPLHIYDYEGPFLVGLNNNPIYRSPDLTDMDFPYSELDPLVIKPGEYMTFNVIFKPDEEKDYPDSIVFISNTIKNPAYNNGEDIDSVCVLNGIGIMSSLEVTNYNWERKRIHRPNTPFEIDPYPAVINALNLDTCIRLFNGGSAPITIQRIKNTEEVGDISAFQFNRSELLRTIQPNEEAIVEVKFQPEQTGVHKLTFEYETNPPLGNKITTTLEGIGILPKIETENIDFGSTIANDFDNYVTDNFTITNLDWEFGDAVTITGLAENNIYPKISDNWDTHPEPFRYDKLDQNGDPVIVFPIVLQPGESRVLEGEFVAKSGDPAVASLTTESDAEAEVTSNWTGDGLLQPWTVTGGDTIICTGIITELEVTIKNDGETELTVTDMTLGGANAGKFTILDPLPTLQIGEEKTVRVQFIGDKDKGTYTTDVTVTTNAVEDNVKSAILTGEVVHYTRDIAVTPQTTIEPVKIDRFVSKTIELLPGNSFDLSTVKGFIVNVSFNGDFLKIQHDPSSGESDGDLDGIWLGSAFDNYPPNAFKVERIGLDQKNGSISIGIERDAYSGYITGGFSGELLKINMGTYLPKTDSRFSNFDVSVTVDQDEGECVTINPSGASILVDSTCVYPIRKIVFTGNTTSLMSIRPNPVIGDEATIEFEIGMENCPTKIEVYNSANQLVATPVNQNMQPGRYDVSVPVGSWSSGSYYYILRAGSYEEQKRMVIVK